MEILNFDEALTKISFKKILELETKVYHESKENYSNEIWKENNFSQELNKKNIFSFFAIENNKLLGFTIGYEFSNSWGHISRVAVDSAFQKRGIGEQIMSKQINVMVENEIKYVTIETKNNNYPALKLYKKMNFNIMKDDLLRLYIDIRGREKEAYIGKNTCHIGLVRCNLNSEFINHMRPLHV